MTARLRISAIALAAALPGAALAEAPEGWAPLLQPSELAEILDSAEQDVRIIRISGDYAAGHIPGAVQSAYGDWRGPSENPGALRDIEHFRDLVQSLGVSAQTPVVVVHQGANPTDMGTAARVYWTLKSLGVEDLALLNGGFAAWQAADLPVSTDTPEIARTDYAPEFDNTWRITTAEVEQAVEAGDARLIDARPEGFFEGLTWSIANPGTIPGAGNLTYDVWFEGNDMVGPEGAARIAAEYDQTDAPMTVSFCNTGHWAAINWFALSELAEVDNTRLYAESMAEWTAGDHELMNEPGRMTYYWRSTTRWLGDLF